MPRPRIAVLLATRNGLRYLPDQLDSILAQRDVDVRVIALDDASTDGTRDWLVERAATDPRILVLPEAPASGSAAANFYRLIERAPLQAGELVALADQDDIWLPDKLARHAGLIAEGAAGVSSDITSFDERGRRTLIRKSYPQREFDFLLESPGPGCSFLMTRELVDLVREVLAGDASEDARAVDFHDSLIYAVARSRGLPWRIDDRPSLNYRQHGGNVMGSNVGLRGKLSRFGLIRRRWHRGQATRMARVGAAIAPPTLAPGLNEMLELLTDQSWRARRRLAARAGQLRRRPRDRRIIAVLIASGIW